MELYQQSKNGEQRHFLLKAGRELHVTLNRQHRTCRYAFSILALMDNGKQVYSYSKYWLVLSIVSAAAMLGLPYFEKLTGVNIQPSYLYVMLGLFSLSLLSFLCLVKTFNRRFVLYSSHTQLPLVEFWVNLPNRKEFQNYINELETTISQHKEEMKIPFSRQLAGEIRTLRRVSEAGVLSESVYQAAKAKLLIMSDQGS